MKKYEQLCHRGLHFFKNVSLILFLFTICNTHSLHASLAYAEQTTFSLNIKNGTVGQVFSHIEKNSELIFIYHGANIDLERKVSINSRNESVDKILEKLFAGTDIEYIINDRQIIVRKKKEQPVVAKTVEVQAPQQEKFSVRGTVRDANGEPLIGANVVEKGNASNGTITDINGEYMLNVDNPNSILIFSYVGFKNLEQNIRNNRTVNVALEEDASTLDELIVVGYARQKKGNISGAVAAVSSEVLENRPIISPGQGLQGVIPNLNITITSGQASAAPTFNVRGTASINDGADPLILIDNIPASTGEFSRINPNDIESVSVLKDAASAAIYGARAAFGVILVTTKSAKKNSKVNVSVNAYYNTRKLGRLPEIVTDPYTVMDYKSQAAYPLYNPLYSPERMELARQHSQNPSLDPVVLDPDDPTKWFYLGNTNWMDEVYNSTAPSYQVNTSLSYRNDKVGTYFSAAYERVDGMFRYGNDIQDKYNMRFKIDYQVTDWLNISNNSAFTQRVYDQPALNGQSLVDYFHEVNRTPSMSVPKNPDGTWTNHGGGLLGRLQEGGRNVNNSREFTTSFGMTLDLIKNILQIKGDANFRRDSDLTRRAYYPYYYREGPDMELKKPNSSSQAYNYSTFYEYNIYNIFADYHQTFAEKHAVNALVGFNQESYRSNGYSLNKLDLISEAYPSPQLATGTVTGSESITTWAVRGMFFRLNYIFNNRYIAELDGRYDGTSRFPKNDRFGFFPSGSLAWIISEENFMKPLKETIKLDFLKFRASYGALGNQLSTSAYPYIPTMSAATISRVLDGTKPIGINMPGIVSNSLTWEKVVSTNFGVDMNFFNNRLATSFDYYIRDTKGMLTTGKALPLVLGTDVPQENAADLRTRGWELSVNWRDRFSLGGSPFNYNVTLALSNSWAVITKFDNENKIYSRNYVGKRIGEIWGLTTVGFFESDEEVASWADQTAVGEDDQKYLFYKGDLKFLDRNKDGKINNGKGTVDDPGDFKIIGNSSAQYPFSVDLGGDWKGFDLRLFFQGIGKRDWYPAGGHHYFWGIYAQPWTNVQTHNLDHWTEDNPNGYFPRVKAYIAESTGSEMGAPQTKYLQNAAYIRLKNLTFGYTLPKFLTQKWNIDRVRFYFSGENLWEKSGIRANLDPETAISNNGRNYPMQRYYSFGVNINF